MFTTILVGSTPIGGLIAGALASLYGTPTAILIGGLAATTVGLAAGLVAWSWGLLGAGVTGAAPTREGPDPH